MAQRQPVRAAQAAPSEILSQMNLGLNLFTDPTLLSYKQWAGGTNVISGPFGYLQRARFANVVAISRPVEPWQETPAAISSGFFSAPGISNYLLLDSNEGSLLAFDTGADYAAQTRINLFFNPQGVPNQSLIGPWSRQVLENIVYEMNGAVKQTGTGAFAATIYGFGLDAPDASPQVSIAAGTSQALTSISRLNGTVTAVFNNSAAIAVVGSYSNVNGVSDSSFDGSFVIVTASPTGATWQQQGQNVPTIASSGTIDNEITKTIGRSYSYAWENANKSHIGPPSPSTQYVDYQAQNGALQVQEAGLINTASGSAIVVGVGTAFSQSWVGKILWAPASAPFPPYGFIASVQSPTQLTLQSAANATLTGSIFMVVPVDATHIRFYATSDGGATYFRIARNAFVQAATTQAAAGLVYIDSANSEPPSAPFTTETSQLYNLPPPIGQFLQEYQGVLIVYGVQGSPQTFYYSNQTLTAAGLLQESFAPLNQVTLPIQNAGIKGMAEFPGALVIWSDKQDMFRLTGLLTDNTSATASQQGAQISALPYNLGCATPFAVVVTPLGAIWLTSNAEIWLFTDAYAPRNIGRPIQQILNSIAPGQLANARAQYYHTTLRNWVVFTVAANGGDYNNTALILDLDMLAANGQPSFFTFDMATNQPSWYRLDLTAGPGPGNALQVVYETGGIVRCLAGGSSPPVGANANVNMDDVDFTVGYGTERSISNASTLTHHWGNESAQFLKRPTWLRFITNRDPSLLESDGWSFAVNGVDDDYYTIDIPLTLALIPGQNDALTLSGSPAAVPYGLPFRVSQGLFRIGGVNFVAGRRLSFQINFPSAPGTFQFKQIQMAYGPSPPE